MYSEILANATSFIAMVLIASGYFFNRKSLYLFFQSAGISFLVLSYFFSLEYFAMLGVSVALIRTLVFYAYERKQKNAPYVWSFAFCSVTVVLYIACLKINGGTFCRLDAVYLFALCGYAFVFRIRNVKTVRFLCLFPTAICVVYNTFIDAPVFSVLSYIFELSANVISIILYYYATNIKITEIPRRNKNEQSN